MPRIVEDDVFFKVSGIIKSRSQRATSCRAKETYLLTGKVVCGYCGSAFTGNCVHSGRNKRKHVTYKCGGKSKRGELHCNAKDVNRNYLEQFVVQQISEIIFSEDRIPLILAGYEDSLAMLNQQSDSVLNTLKEQRQGIQMKIDNIISVITQSGSPSLLATLDRLEQELAQVNEKIEAHEQSSGCKSVDPAKVVAVYRKAQQMFLDGTLPQRRQLINLYVKRVVVYDDYVRIELHNVPGSLKGSDARLTDDSEPCDVHMILARFSRKKIHAFIPRDKNVSKIGGGEAQQNNPAESENMIKLNELPLMYTLGEDKLTEIFLIGKRTLRFICSESE